MPYCKIKYKGGAALGERKFCYKCMETYESHKTACPHCGYAEETMHNSMYITPGTILHERYLVGVLESYNGEGATYIGYDKVIGCKVLIREYMPINLCIRVKGKPTISVNYNNLAKYKAFMAEYTELNKSLARLRNNTNIAPVLDMFAENNTTYTIFEYIEGKKLVDYLKENAGELSWSEVTKLFPPLFTTIGILHNAGITHRAVSPDTVYITEKGELRLHGFCVSAVRTANAGLEYELFRGYAAPEQYSSSSSSRQGSWTDVYSICALLYRILTGCMPPDSLSRMENDNLCEPSRLNNNIPPQVSRVIMEGMNLSGRDRIQTITELVTRLFQQSAPVKNLTPVGGYSSSGRNEGDYGNNGYRQEAPPPAPVYEPEPQYEDEYYDDDYEEEYEDSYSYEKVTTVDKLKVPIIIAILLFAILMIIAVAFLNILGGDKDSTDNGMSGYSSAVTDNIVEGTTEPSTETTTETFDSLMFDLKGKYFENTKEKYKDYFTLKETYEYNDEYEKDQIFEQSIEPGQPFNKGDVIEVKVSKGKAESVIPEFEGLTITQYESLLKSEGILYSLIPEKSTVDGTPNTVIGLLLDGEKAEPGDKISNKDGKSLVVYYLPKDVEIVTTTTTTTTTTTETTTTTTTTTATPTEAPTQAPTDPPQEQATDAPQEQPAA